MSIFHILFNALYQENSINSEFNNNINYIMKYGSQNEYVCITYTF